MPSSRLLTAPQGSQLSGGVRIWVQTRTHSSVVGKIGIFMGTPSPAVRMKQVDIPGLVSSVSRMLSIAASSACASRHLMTASPNRLALPPTSPQNTAIFQRDPSECSVPWLDQLTRSQSPSDRLQAFGFRSQYTPKEAAGRRPPAEKRKTQSPSTSATAPQRARHRYPGRQEKN
ncbi:hypothetical protein PtA15_6A711 [Puccinia triticina]|uniref:Uncharacterized protein n=1 Tax=Puccinia triticina TaxID=208348 RepID=A0ABY7CPL9_9BASI|nr:uncharacterized protein PtA15_6A711 [Puccinia triticina]WAQ86081.1 hypothetical protein PtA15_6A711 [Puccinia triticina]